MASDAGPRLTWTGKHDPAPVATATLREDPARGYDPDNGGHDNRLIHSDNIAALRALQEEFAGRVRAVYIDPPFNTGRAMEHYDDQLQHARWLGEMRARATLLRELLTDDGTLVVHIDDHELAYLVVLLDEVFGRRNRCSIVTFKQSSVSGPKSFNAGLVPIANYLVIYAKDRARWRPNRVYAPRARDRRYTQYIANPKEPHTDWRFVTLRSAFAAARGLAVKQLRAEFGDDLEAELEAFVLADPARVVRLARVKPKDVNAAARALLLRSREEDGVFRSPREGRDDYYFARGQQLLFYASKTQRVDGRWVTGQAASTIWDDLLSNNLHNEGGVGFSKGKKPEALLKRVLELTTDPGDRVLDAFAGSGTTGAVAHKLDRRWIMIERGEHCFTHVIPRLRAVIDGADPSGITQAVGWRGGGGFRFFSVASE